jgi:hypothetical protein
MGVQPWIYSTIIPLTAVLVPNKLSALWGAIDRTLLTATHTLLHYSYAVKKKQLKINKALHFISYIMVGGEKGFT